MKRITLSLLFLLLPATTASADIFELPGGGKVEGKWVNRSAQSSAFYVVKTAAGTITLAKKNVHRRKQRSVALEYQRIAPDFADNIQDQWRIAEWCRKKLLSRQRKSHLLRILQLQPDHAASRAAMGYSQVDGQWVLREDWRREQGYEYHKGRWRTSVEVKSMRAEEAVDALRNAWLSKLRNLRSQLLGPRAAEAQASILAIDDPHAVKALVQMLMSDPLRKAKMLYINSLANIGDGAALQALILVSVNDPDEEIFHACLDVINRSNDPRAVHAYIDLLKNHNNVRVNRAAAALARLQNRSAIKPLIEALVTTHYVTVTRGNSTPGGVTTSFSRGAADGICQTPPRIIEGLSAGRKTTVAAKRTANHQVMGALVDLTGMNYGYNQNAWRRWHLVQQRRAAQTVSLREQ